MIRVAAPIQSFDPVIGGAQRQLEALGPELARRGVELRCITRRCSGAPTREQRPGLDVRRVRVPRSGPASSAVYTASGTAEVRRFRPHLVHAHALLSPSTIGLLAHAAWGVPVVAKVLSGGPGGDLDRLGRKPLGELRLRAMGKRFAAFISVSEAVDRELIAAGLPGERLWRIPNGVDLDRFRPPAEGERARLRAALDLGDEIRNGTGRSAPLPLILYCGRLAPVKRLDLLIEAVAELPARLLLVGEGSEQGRLRGLIASRGLGGRVTILPQTGETAALYRAADIYASTSTTEGMSNSVLEAMASGLPVVAAPAAGMDELVSERTGSIAAEGSAARVATALGSLLDSATERERRGAAARELVGSRYSLEATADRLVELYRSLVPGSASADG